jgi:hypothetical protein
MRYPVSGITAAVQPLSIFVAGPACEKAKNAQRVLDLLLGCKNSTG